MTTVPLGASAYERLYAGVPEVKLQNRWVEASPTNLRERTMLLSRPGTTAIQTFAASDGYGLKPMRGQYFQGGLFSDALFVVSGENLYRYDTDYTVTLIEGVISGTGHPEVTWQKGIGYERLWIADGLLLQFYGGTTAANGTLTGAVTTQTIQIGSVYYQWVSSITGGTGTSGDPFQVINTGDPFANLVAAIIAGGTPGVTYSTAITGPNTQVTAAGDGNSPIVTVTITAVVEGTAGNSIATVLTSGTGLTFSGAHLINGGIDALQGVSVPDGVGIRSLAEVSSYVLASVTDSQKVFFVQPGAVVIDPLDFFEKESSPDNVLHMRTVGDQVLIMGASSAENWYATGELSAPFAPIEGRVYQRGVIEGSPCVVDDGVMLIGNDGIAYSIGYQFGGEAEWGVHRISNHGIEERIRRQLRREAGLTP